MSQKRLADHLGCDVKVVNRIVNGRSAVTAEMALKLGASFRTSAEFWMNAQKAIDLFEQEAKSAGDSEVGQFASQALGLLRQHLGLAHLIANTQNQSASK